MAIPIALAIIAFVSFLTNAYFTDSPRSSESLADKVDLNITEETVSADNAKAVDLEALQDSLYTIGTGSGFLISPQDVLTAAYNVAGITRVTLKQGGKTVNGTVVGRTDAIAVIRIEKVKAPPFSFSHAIVGSDESVVTLTPDEQIEGTLTFEEDSYKREFDLPNRAIGSPIVTASGRVLGIHLATKTLPVALFEQDVLSFLESDTPAPPPTTKRSAPAAELAPVAPITPVPKREDPVEPAPAPEPEPAPVPEPEAAPETPEPTEPPVEEPAPVEEEPPAEPEQPAEEPETPPVTEQPAEPDVPVTEPAEPVEPEQPATQDKEAEATAPVKKQDKPKPTATPDKKEKPPVAKEKPVAEETAEDEPTEDEESTSSE
ncbi:serine protease [Exiguobacterium sp. TNDT2]|uniref:S1 family peptidase n=1 Tax=Exiguobacterium sp. TNDT2 TaxID=2233531 RepID=UPI000DEF6228|nr:serine protease [Exiguobacterium sp. TNDT2]